MHLCEHSIRGVPPLITPKFCPQISRNAIVWPKPCISGQKWHRIAREVSVESPPTKMSPQATLPRTHIRLSCVEDYGTHACSACRVLRDGNVQRQAGQQYMIPTAAGRREDSTGACSTSICSNASKQARLPLKWFFKAAQEYATHDSPSCKRAQLSGLQ